MNESTKGMNSENGLSISGVTHLRQSIRDILKTPIGSRVMRREYGSRLFELVDSPLNQTTLVEIYAEVGLALERWEPRFKLINIEAQQTQPGKLLLSLEGEYIPSNQLITLSDIDV